MQREARKAKKIEAILDGAFAEFLQHGYAGTSVDAIVVRTGVSKPTVYAHFKNKEALFAAILKRAVDRILLPAHHVDLKRESVRDTLYNIATNYARTVMAPDMLSLHRLVAGEAQRFPKLGGLYFQAGYGATNEGFARLLLNFHKHGVLHVPDGAQAALHFWGLVLGPSHSHQVFNPAHPMSWPQVDRSILSGLDAFLRAYTIPGLPAKLRSPGS